MRTKKNSNYAEAGKNDELAHLFRYASRMLARSYHRHDRGSHAQHRIYALLKERGPMPQKELMDLLGIRSASLSELLSKMERREIITRSRNEADRRGFIVAINEAYERSRENADFVSDDRNELAEEAPFTCLDEAEQQQLAGLLQKIIASFDQDEGDSRGYGSSRRSKLCGRGRRGRGR